MIRSRAIMLSTTIALFLLAACSACEENSSSSASAPTPQTISLAGRYQTHVLTIEIADDPAEHAKGLSERESLSSNTGMLFIFPYESERPFWMRNTHISLDIIFLDSERRIVGIVRRAKPDSDEQLSVDKACRYVLEVEGGLSDRVGIKEGDTLKF